MKTALAVIGCLVLNLLVSAASFGTDVLESWLPPACQYHGQFEQTRTLKALPQPLTSRGRFLFDCNAGVIWQTESPLFNTVIYTVKNTHFRINGSGQGELLKGIVHNNMSAMLQALMGGNRDSLIQDFVVAPGGAADTSQTESITLVPKSTSVKRYLEQIQLQKKSDSMDIILVNNADQGTQISTSAMTTIDTDTEQQCATLFGPKSVACDALYFPAKLADTLQPGR